MKTYVIDTNAVISFVTDRNSSQQEKIAEVFENTNLLKNQILCPQNVLTELVYVMEKIYSTPKSLIREIIKDFTAMPGVHVIHDIDIDLLLEYWPEKITDFGDAIVACVCKQKSASAILTFDEKFIVTFAGLGFVSAF
jgi:predicted nucleic-acid-binding protein